MGTMQLPSGVKGTNVRFENISYWSEHLVLNKKAEMMVQNPPRLKTDGSVLHLCSAADSINSRNFQPLSFVLYLLQKHDNIVINIKP